MSLGGTNQLVGTAGSEEAMADPPIDSPISGLLLNRVSCFAGNTHTRIGTPAREYLAYTADRSLMRSALSVNAVHHGAARIGTYTTET